MSVLYAPQITKSQRDFAMKHKMVQQRLGAEHPVQYATKSAAVKMPQLEGSQYLPPISNVALQAAWIALYDTSDLEFGALSIRQIQAAVAKHYGVSIPNMISHRRTIYLMRPRQVAMFLAKRLTTRSLPEIGRQFSDRDHTTVLHGARKIESLLTRDEQLRADIRILVTALAPEKKDLFA